MNIKEILENIINNKNQKYYITSPVIEGEIIVEWKNAINEKNIKKIEFTQKFKFNCKNRIEERIIALNIIFINIKTKQFHIGKTYDILLKSEIEENNNYDLTEEIKKELMNMNFKEIRKMKEYCENFCSQEEKCELYLKFIILNNVLNKYECPHHFMLF